VTITERLSYKHPYCDFLLEAGFCAVSKGGAAGFLICYRLCFFDDQASDEPVDIQLAGIERSWQTLRWL
jgi:hypothetical protein